MTFDKLSPIILLPILLVANYRFIFLCFVHFKNCLHISPMKKARNLVYDIPYLLSHDDRQLNKAQAPIFRLDLINNYAHLFRFLMIMISDRYWSKSTNTMHCTCIILNSIFPGISNIFTLLFSS